MSSAGAAGSPRGRPHRSPAPAHTRAPVPASGPEGGGWDAKFPEGNEEYLCDFFSETFQETLTDLTTFKENCYSKRYHIQRVQTEHNGKTLAAPVSSDG